MRSPFLCLLGAVLVALLAANAAARELVGVRTIDVPVRQRGIPLKVTIWYPATAGGTSVLVGEDRLFQGAAAALEAPVAPGGFRSSWCRMAPAAASKA